MDTKNIIFKFLFSKVDTRDIFSGFLFLKVNIYPANTEKSCVGRRLSVWPSLDQQHRMAMIRLHILVCILYASV